MDSSFGLADLAGGEWFRTWSFSDALWCVGIWTAFWFFSGRRKDSRRTDLSILLFISIWRCKTYLGPYIFGAVSSAGMLAAVVALLTAYTLYTSTTATYEPSQGTSPWLLPSRTSHTRLFPKKHSFAYSLLQVAVPVGANGRFSSLISVGNVKRKGWYHVQASDYLARNSSDTDLQSKLRTYLRSQGVEDDSWDHAYLITAPRFLGYAFNPVSFWYIYTAENVLAMMILEVNNTFDERRMYLLHAKDPEERSEDSHSSNPPTPGEDASIAIPKDLASDGKFRKAWTKDFHVSPFNSRKGYYLLTAVDPFGGKREDDAAPFFSNTITLKSSKDHVKLIARIFSNGKPINAAECSWTEMTRFICSWFWVGFLTFPRILKEAAALFWRRGLHVWFRPEVLSSSIGRSEAKIESDLAVFFEHYLCHLVRNHPAPLRVLYTSNLAGSHLLTFSNHETGSEADLDHPIDTIDLRVLSPVFFARFMHYSTSTEALDRECIFTDEKNRTVWVNRPDLLHGLLKPTEAELHLSVGVAERLRWNVHKMLRCSPPSPAYLPSATLAHGDQRRESKFSDLDYHVMQLMPKKAGEYRALCARLFLARRLAFGFVEVIDLLHLLVRVRLAWSATSVLRLG